MEIIIKLEEGTKATLEKLADALIGAGNKIYPDNWVPTNEFVERPHDAETLAGAKVTEPPIPQNVEMPTPAEETPTIPTTPATYEIATIQKACKEHADLSVDNKATILRLIKETGSTKGVVGIPAEKMEGFVKSLIEAGVAI